MTKRESVLQRRLHLAHTFIGSLASEAEDYGSEYSGSVSYCCKEFLKENRPITPHPRYVLVDRNEWMDLRKMKMQARLAQLKSSPADVGETS